MTEENESKTAEKQPRVRVWVVVVACVATLVVCVVIGVSLFLNMGKAGLRDGNAASGNSKVVTFDGKRYRFNEDVISVCVVGSDKKNGAPHGEGLNGQADAIVVVAANTRTGKITCLSIPRNTMVDIDLQLEGHFHGTDKYQICLSYALGSTDEESEELLRRALSRLLYNVPMGKMFVLDLPCIDYLVDAVGGVKVEALEDIPYTSIKKGDEVMLRGLDGEVIHMEGEDYSWDSGTAAWYVRYRDAENPDSSLQRQARGMQFIRAFADRVLEKAKGDPSVLADLYAIAFDYSTTDLEASEFAYLASMLVTGGMSAVDFVSLDGEVVYDDTSEWAQFIVDQDALRQTVIDIYYEPVEN